MVPAFVIDVKLSKREAVIEVEDGHVVYTGSFISWRTKFRSEDVSQSWTSVAHSLACPRGPPSLPWPS